MTALFSLMVVAVSLALRMDGPAEAVRAGDSNDGENRQDPFDVARFFVLQGYRFERTLPSHLPYYAAIVQRDPGSAREVFVVRAGGDSARLIAGSVRIGEFTPESVSWRVLPDSSVSGGIVLKVTFNDPVENMVGSYVYGVGGDSLRRVFWDSRTACEPAQFVDLDDDGAVEFIWHDESPAPDDCAEACHLIIRERFGVQPGWLRVGHWMHDSLIEAESGFAALYGRRASAYAQVDQWLRSDASDAAWCRSRYWLTADPGMFARWAQRARELARQPE